MTAFTRSMLKPNNRVASMHSMPLFISVEESTVIFGLIFQTGCLRASRGVTFFIRSVENSLKGPPDAVSVTRFILARGSPRIHCQMALCSLSRGRS